MTTVNYPYVKFMTTWTTHKDGNQIDDPREVLFNVSSVHNATEETIKNLRLKGWKVLGYGNFPSNSHYAEFANYLEKLTDIGMEKEIEARVQARLSQESVSKVEKIKKSAVLKNEQV